MVKRVRALERGLTLLQALNKNDGTDLSSLVRVTDISRGTAYRMMETLVARGLVHKGTEAGRYWLTQNVQDLSSGYGDDSIMIKDARQPLDELCRQTEWPISLTTPLGIQMIVRAHTDFISPLVLVKIPIGHQVSMINSAAGLAYLAYCTPTERDVLLPLILNSPAIDPFEELVRDRHVLDTIIHETYERGYSYCVTDTIHAAMGFPIILAGRPVAALSIRYFTSAVSRKDVVERHLEPTKKAAAAIAALWLAFQS